MCLLPPLLWCDQVEVISRKFALLQGTSTSCPTVFSPPMSQQRHAYLADLVYKFGATTIVDLGCGEASLFRHMLKQVTCSHAVSIGCMLQCCT